MTDSDYLCIGNIEHLKDKPHEQVASAMLHELARLVGPIMIQRKYKIDTLMEFFPKDKHLNGRHIKAYFPFTSRTTRVIYLRLREAENESLFWSIEDCIDTMLHELAHIVHKHHSWGFQALLKLHHDEYAELVRKRMVGDRDIPRLPSYQLPKSLFSRIKVKFSRYRGCMKCGSGVDALEETIQIYETHDPGDVRHS